MREKALDRHEQVMAIEALLSNGNLGRLQHGGRQQEADQPRKKSVIDNSRLHSRTITNELKILLVSDKQQL